MTLAHQIPMSEAEFDRQVAAATKRGRDAVRTEPQAAAVKYDARRKAAVISLTNGCLLTIPVRLLEGLAGATTKQLANVVTLGEGIAIEWPALDQQFAVAALLNGVFGFPQWMKQLADKSRRSVVASKQARRGSAAVSGAKSNAARSNGAKGGRAKKPAKAAP